MEVVQVNTFGANFVIPFLMADRPDFAVDPSRWFTNSLRRSSAYANLNDKDGRQRTSVQVMRDLRACLIGPGSMIARKTASCRGVEIS
ncbi:hypothetical protein [Noviherbaspirillum sp.]|jgi:hypothetical protein|uniref:hypothetical protein n=1 Tax=Noviherbaspirillum sp. TaxID=1926288 RepID=UPI00260110C7|nr:hypothetical protein [Noviherbaspirillum sp.]